MRCDFPNISWRSQYVISIIISYDYLIVYSSSNFLKLTTLYFCVFSIF